jgi:hypothetical protein
MAGIELCKFTHGLSLYILRSYPERLAGIELCKFTHGLGLYVNLHNSMPAMNYFLNIHTTDPSVF